MLYMAGVRAGRICYKGVLPCGMVAAAMFNVRDQKKCRTYMLIVAPTNKLKSWFDNVTHKLVVHSLERPGACLSSRSAS